MGRNRRELLLFGRAVQRGGGASAAADHHRNLVEVARADLALVASGGVPTRLAGELRLLELGVGGHSRTLVCIRQLEHAVVEGVKSSQSDELKAIAHLRQRLLEICDGGVVELALPVE